MDSLRTTLHFDNHELWLFIAVALAAVLTLQTIESAVETAWPHERRLRAGSTAGRRGESLWGLVGLLVLPGMVLALANLGAILWNDAQSTRTMTIGGLLMLVGWGVFVFASLNWLGVRAVLNETGVVGPIALIVILLVGDLLLLSAFIDVAPTVSELVDGIRKLLPFS